MGEKSLTELMQELAALEDNAHNLADAQGAIRAKEREIIKAFATAYEELKTLFEGSNLEPIAKAVTAQVCKDFEVELKALVERMDGVVEAAKQQLDDAKVQLAEANAKIEALETSVASHEVSLASHYTAINEVQDKVVAIEEHPALSIPPLDKPAATDTTKTD